MFSIFFIYLCIIIIAQMPSMINCKPIDKFTKISSNSTLAPFPCFPPIDPKAKELPPINEKEFKECMLAKINNFSRLDDQIRAVFDRTEKFNEPTAFKKTLAAADAQQKELMNELFDMQDMNKVRLVWTNYLF